MNGLLLESGLAKRERNKSKTMIRKKVEAGKKPRLIFSDMEMPQHLDEREEESIHNAHEKSNSDGNDIESRDVSWD